MRRPTHLPRARDTMPSRALMLTLCALLAGLLFAACGSTHTTATGQDTAETLSTTAASSNSPTVTTAVTTPAQRTASIRVSSATTSATLPTSQGFLGIATELSTVTTLSGTPSNPDTAFVNLLKNLSIGAPLLLRLGGDSTDWDWWKVPGMSTPPAIQYTMTPAWGADVKSLLQAVGAKATLGVNLELDNERVSAYEVQQYLKYLGAKNVYGFALGNEPELYSAFAYYKTSNGSGVPGRTRASWTVPAYGRDFTRISKAIPTSDALLGPEIGGPHWLAVLGQVLSDLPSRMKLVTIHAYPMKHCSASGPAITTADFFQPSSLQGLASTIGGFVKIASNDGKTLRVDEIGGISCGGYPGVSTSFAEALWALNVLPDLWRAGVAGVNFQDVKGNLNQVFTPTQSGSSMKVSVEPEYYGLLAFAQVAPAGSQLLKVSGPSQSSLYSFAVQAPGGRHNVVLTNVGTSADTFGVTVAGSSGPGVVSLLSASSLQSTAAPTLGGQSLSESTGELTGTSRYTLVQPNAKSVYEVTIPAHSAAIFTVGS